MELEKVKVSVLYALVLIRVFAVLTASHLTKSIVVLLVADTLLLLLLKFKLESIDIFSKRENEVRLLLDVSLSAKNISFAAGYLLPYASNLTLGLVRGPVLVS